MNIINLTKHEKSLVCMNLAKTLSRHLYDGINAHNHCKNLHKTECQIQVSGQSVYISMPYLGKSALSDNEYMHDIDADYIKLGNEFAETCAMYNTLPELVKVGKPSIFRYGKSINISIPIEKAKAKFSMNDYECVIRRMAMFHS